MGSAQFLVGVGLILVVKLIGYVPPNPRIFNIVDHITFTHFFENRIFDNWLMFAFLFAIVITVLDMTSDIVKNK
ncbi:MULTISPECIES: hypothetical protein [unclassified Staphylococcus]|uniref:hypothetical protein n=1 Tax=unclassified Staphylococcus TaxID=91994 RepID=UPI0021D3011B|nr:MULTISPECIES: hypothetical protein [unclassified Staphylococcus]UXR78792.1 hypothetical protein MUA92_02565 [Staphylococcus sp. IVB6227]UXR82953.1 hypothetical protein MUA51_02535 [Staphylococcus sp. IVB6214]